MTDPASPQDPRPPRGPGWVDAAAWLAALILLSAATAGALWAVWHFGKLAVDVRLPKADERVIDDNTPRPGSDEETIPIEPAPKREPPIGAGAVVIRNPSWSRRPEIEYPQRAMDLGIERARVEIECVVRSDGRLEPCIIISETPQGAGFGEAALAGARQARLAPRSVNGVAQDARVRFSVPFRLE